MRLVVQEPFGCGKKVCWLDPNKIKSMRDLLQYLRHQFGDEDPIMGIKLSEHNAEVKDIKVLRDGDTVKIIHSTDLNEANDEWITFNVGGCRFSTYRSTIVNSAPKSVLARMLNRDERMHCRRDKQGSFLIDRSPRYFEVLLDCLRNGQLNVPNKMCRRSLMREAQFYGIDNEPIARMRRDFENRQYAGKHEWITLNVRGHKFQTYRSTIMNYSYSGSRNTLADMISDNHPMCRKDMDGCYLIDRNPFTFPYILEYLKRRILYWPPGFDSTYMYYECMDYGITDPTIRSIRPSNAESWGNRQFVDNLNNRLGFSDSNQLGYSDSYNMYGRQDGHYSKGLGYTGTDGSGYNWSSRNPDIMVNDGYGSSYMGTMDNDPNSFNNRRRRRHSDAFLEYHRGRDTLNNTSRYFGSNMNMMNRDSNDYFTSRGGNESANESDIMNAY